MAFLFRSNDDLCWSKTSDIRKFETATKYGGFSGDVRHHANCFSGLGADVKLQPNEANP
jgi:hypothetical protein